MSSLYVCLPDQTTDHTRSLPLYIITDLLQTTSLA